jgi:hypothetical protein
MWASVALMATLNLAPMPVNELKLTNDRVTHGLLGWERADSKNPKLYPGDIFIVVFDIEGLSATPEGLIKYSIGFDLVDKAGKMVLEDKPKELQATASLGGNRLVAATQVALSTNTAVGEYTVKVSVKDLTVKDGEAVVLKRTFEVVPVQLGFTNLIVNYATDPPTPAPPIAVPGQGYLVNFAPVGFALDPKANQPDLHVEMRVLDDAGKPVLKMPFTGDIKMAPAEFKKIYPMQFLLNLNRPGKFQIQLKVTDNLTKKSAEQLLDFKVVEPK